jgi:hypothetical protein
VKVKVLQPFQVSHEGVIHRPGDTAEVPDHIGAHWLRSGWVEQAGRPRAKAAAAEPAEPAQRDE